MTTQQNKIKITLQALEDSCLVYDYFTTLPVPLARYNQKSSILKREGWSCFG